MADTTRKSNATSVTWKRWLFTLLKIALTTIVVCYIGRAINSHVMQLEWDQIRLNFKVLIVASGCFMLHRVLVVLAWYLVFRSLGGDLPWTNIYPIVWTASLGKYIPGKVASIAGYVAIMMRFGVRLPVAISSSLLPTLLTVVVGLLISSPLLLMKTVRDFVPVAWVWPVLLILGTIICLHPAVFIRLCNLVLRRMGRPPINARPSTWKLILTVLLIALRCGILGLGVWLIARSFTDTSISQYPLFIATATCASVIGFLAFFAPAGIGVQEGAYLVILGPVIGYDTAALLAILTRVFGTFIDICTGTVGTIMLRSMPRISTKKSAPGKPVRNLVTKQ